MMNASLRLPAHPSPGRVEKYADYLESSPYDADGGKKVGKLPASVSLGNLKALEHPESPIRAIRAKCLDCCGAAASEVRKCVAFNCPLWPFRMGRNPFHGNTTALRSASHPSAVETSDESKS